VGALYTKVKEEWDQEKRAIVLVGNNCSGSENSGSLLR